MDRNVSCRALATAAWAAALAWFLLAMMMSYGSATLGLLLWSLPAGFLFRATLRWWERAGGPLSPALRAFIVDWWRGIAVCAVVFHALVGAWWMLAGNSGSAVTIGIAMVVIASVCVVFPVVVTGVAIRHSWRLGSAL